MSHHFFPPTKLVSEPIEIHLVPLAVLVLTVFAKRSGQFGLPWTSDA